MLVFHKSHDGGTFEETPLSNDCLIKMAKNALWAEKLYIEFGMMEQAFRYGRIWARVVKCLGNRLSK